MLCRHCCRYHCRCCQRHHCCCCVDNVEYQPRIERLFIVESCCIPKQPNRAFNIIDFLTSEIVGPPLPFSLWLRGRQPYAAATGRSRQPSERTDASIETDNQPYPGLLITFFDGSWIDAGFEQCPLGRYSCFPVALISSESRLPQTTPMPPPTDYSNAVPILVGFYTFAVL